MNAPWRIFAAALAALLAAGTPALAQEAPPPAQDAVIGDPQLRNFSINGTVTRPVEEAAPAPRQGAPRTTSATGEQAAQRPSQPARETAQRASRPEPAANEDNDRTAQVSASSEPARPTPARRVELPVVGSADEPAESQPTYAPSQAGLDVAQGGMPVLPWLIAAFALAGAAGWYFLRQRPRTSYAGAGRLNAFDAPRAAPPVRAPPRPATPPKPASTGVVSTRLRPWLDIEFKPVRAVVDEEKAAIAFELSVFNSGSAPARDVLLEASLFNAGPQQDQQIRLFFENPVAKGERIPVIPPLQRVSVNSAVFLQRDKVQPIEIEGRQLFVPMIAFNALYGWGGDKGQSSASYLVGKQTKGEKLAPFRVDLGPRVFRNLDAREHEVRLRK